MTRFQRTLAFVLTHAIDAHSSEPLDPYDYYPTPQDPYTEFVNKGLDPYDYYPTPQDPYTKKFDRDSSDLSGTDIIVDPILCHGRGRYACEVPLPPPHTKKFVRDSSDLSGTDIIVDPILCHGRGRYACEVPLPPPPSRHPPRRRLLKLGV